MLTVPVCTYSKYRIVTTISAVLLLLASRMQPFSAPALVPSDPTPQLPADKKKKGGKGGGKGKGKGKKVDSASGGSGARSRLQEALSTFGWEVSELLRAMSAALKVLDCATYFLLFRVRSRRCLSRVVVRVFPRRFFLCDTC